MINPNIQLNRILERESLRLSLKCQSKDINHVSEEDDGCSDLPEPMGSMGRVVVW
jgi:hypothetical protein